MCIDSCNLLNELNESKNGQCPVIKTNPDCSSRKSQIANLAEQNNIDSDLSGPLVTTCSKDSDCGEIQKCCPINPICPQQGQICQKPLISDFSIPSVPINLNITERKKGKTVILKWQSVFDRNQPTIFVVEGKWSINTPDSEPDMTKWGYLTHTTNSDWVIIRSINRGRWYKFRVAAISKSGSFGYSKPTDLFILSSPPKPPTRPQNLTINQIYLSQDTTSVDVDISWLPPKRSDLPIENYKISWYLRENDNDEILNDDDESGEESEQHQFASNNPTDSDLVSAGQMNKHTIRGLIKNCKYRLEIRAITKHETKTLTSKPFKTRLDTSKISIVPVSSSLKSAQLNEYRGQDFFENKNKIFDKKESSLLALPKVESPLIYNLTVQTPYFLNGLAKARVTWAADYLNNEDSHNQQTLFTLTWFAIKCFGYDRSLPNPITASTVDSHFDVYELKFDCDYVVNVRLGQTELAKSKASPQIVSAQFKVPSCPEIHVISLHKPRCYDKYADVLTGQISDKTINRDIAQNFVYNLMFKIDSTTTFPTTTTTTSTTTSTKSSIDEYAIRKSFRRLPIVNDIEYKVIDKSLSTNRYSVEFSWSVPFVFDRSLFKNYQITVEARDDQVTVDDAYFRSIGAIVDKDQQSFVVREILPRVEYLFQIETIGYDGRHGLIKSVQFKVEDKHDIAFSGINRLDYEDANELFLLRSASTKSFGWTTKWVSILTVLSGFVTSRIFV
ncbi:anosmin-1 [Brachionus plicatilis]|uniref:Anosmin-1 n=1 Tax=Brachionus plicatilis TaxID=10195 RepID=A0A3M7QSG2_BRAPC|nr:anosmin-1 [Brachionus plicatilis]